VNANPSLLDLVITNEENTVLNICSSEPLGKSDHIELIFEYCCQLNVPITNHTHYLYDKGDYKSMTEELLDIDWKSLFHSSDVTAMWSVFHSKLLHLINKYVTSLSTSYKEVSACMYGLTRKY